jgi:nonribosomal peptide synthetase DhbF
MSLLALFEALTVAGLTQWLETQSQNNSLQVLLPLRPSGNEPPLFCIHPAWGLGWCFSGLVKHLPPERPVYALQARGITQPDAEPLTPQEMAADYLHQIQSIQPRGPYHLLGYSLGGNIALEIATQLQKQGEKTALLTMLDSYHPTQNQETTPTEQEQLAYILILAGYPAPSTDDDHTMLTRADVVKSLRNSDNPIAELDDAQLSALISNYINNTQLLNRHSTSTYHGDMLHFTATHDQTENAPTTEAWKPHITGTIDTHNIDCSHIHMTEPTPLAHIGQLLATKLETLSTIHTTATNSA